EVLEGLHAGDVVATSGVFLIAAEARISTAATFWNEAEPAPVESAMPTTSATTGELSIPPTAPAHPAGPKPRTPPAPAASPPETATVYTCPMHPEVRSNAPGKCPKCGMDLVPVPKEGAK